MSSYHLSGSISYINYKFNDKTYHLFGDQHSIPGIFDDYNYIDNQYNKIVKSDSKHQLDYFFVELIDSFYRNHKKLDILLETPISNIYKNTYNEIINCNVSKKTKIFIDKLRRTSSPLIWLRVLFYPYLSGENITYEPYVKFHKLDVRYRSLDEDNIITYIIDYIKNNILPFLDLKEELDMYELKDNYIYLFDYISNIWIHNGDIYLRYINNILFSDEYYTGILSIFDELQLEILNIPSTQGPSIIREQVENLRKIGITINGSNLSDLLNSFFLSLYSHENIQFKISSWMKLHYEKFMNIMDYDQASSEDIKFLYDESLNLARIIIPLLGLEMDLYTLPKIFNVQGEHVVIYAGAAHINVYDKFFKDILGLESQMKINNSFNNILSIPFDPFNLFEL